MRIKECDCGSGFARRVFMDGYGIFLFYGCSKCHDKKMKRYRPDIKEWYECDEPIDED